MSEIFGFDAFSPREIADRVEQIGVQKARLSFRSLFMLGTLAGGFIALGALFYTIVISDQNLSFAWQRLLGGMVFSLGLVMVVIAGAELFTGNNLLIMAWADGRIHFREVLRNWVIVFASNLLGALFVVALVILSNHPAMNHEAIAQQYIKIAQIKSNLPFAQAFFSGILCNVLVCLAVWMAQAGRSVMDKVVVVVFPISAFVAAGFEHCIANMYFIPLGYLLNLQAAQPVSAESLHCSGLLNNLVPVVLGNLCGGSVLVALVYYVIYKKPVSVSN